VKVRYVGPSTTGVLLVLPDGDVEVAADEVVEVPDEVGANLVEQDTWVSADSSRQVKADKADSHKE
jgi:hypothetical protein